MTTKKKAYAFHVRFSQEEKKKLEELENLEIWLSRNEIIREAVIEFHKKFFERGKQK